LKITNILCHASPWSDSHYRFIASQIAPSASIHILSPDPKCDGTGLYAKYYELISTQHNRQMGNHDATKLELDIILRCRLLRDLDRETALFHLRAMWQAMDTVLSRIKPCLILTETIDSYVIDILHFQAKLKNILIIGLVPTFISGYFRITIRGEFVLSRTVANDEIQTVLNMLLDNKYLPDFVQSEKSRFSFLPARRWLSNLSKIPYFWLKRLSPNGRYILHNWAALVMAIKWAHFFPKFSLGNESWRSMLQSSTRPIIYIPLQLIPEATVDYWCEDISAVDYDNYLLQLISRLNNDFTLVFKEHPNALGYRNPKLYTQICQVSSAFFAPTDTPSQQLIDAADAVLVWTGSVGFEAALRGKPILTTCEPYYASGISFKKIHLQTPVSEILEFLDSFDSELAIAQRPKMMSYLLSGVLPGRYIIDGSWSQNKSEHVQYAKNIALQLRGYLSFIGKQQI
jgi:Capsule polysaccharide biosynthesis protein